MGAAFDGVPFLSSRFWDAGDRIVLGYISKPFELSVHVLSNTSPRREPWALMESGPGSQILWPHNTHTHTHTEIERKNHRSEKKKES